MCVCVCHTNQFGEEVALEEVDALVIRLAPIVYLNEHTHLIRPCVCVFVVCVSSVCVCVCPSLHLPLSLTSEYEPQMSTRVSKRCLTVETGFL